MNVFVNMFVTFLKLPKGITSCHLERSREVLPLYGWGEAKNPKQDFSIR
jgi:hypothetical protein